MATFNRAILSFTKRTAGRYAGQWTIVGRRGQVVPKIEAGEPVRNGDAWAVKTSERTVETEADEEIPAYTTTVKTVFVLIPWRLSSQGLTAEETAKIIALAGEQAGEYVVIE